MTDRLALDRAWPGRLVIERHEESGAWIILSVHAVVAGRFDGGTRMRHYPNLSDAVADGMRLAEAMTDKWAVHHVPCGGAKTVLMLPQETLNGSALRSLLHAYGRLIADWRGAYTTGGDIGIGPAELDVVAEAAGGDWVYGGTRASIGAGDSAIITADGVESAMRATAARLTGRSELAGLSVAVQGTGKVGGALVGLLQRAGAHVTVADVRGDAATGLDGARVVSPEEILRTECDILAPCATGGVLGAETIDGLRCRAVVGAANNQLATHADADVLADRGILFAPDFLVNAGGAVADLGMTELGWSRQEALERVRDFGSTLEQVYQEADAAGVTPWEAARARARRFLVQAHG